MKRVLVSLAAIALVLSACGQGGTGDSQAGKGTIRVALGDIESVETLALFIALDRVRERGVEVELNELADEDLAYQAVVNGQSDVGLGAPYGLIEGNAAPLRIVCQLAKAQYYPVADKAAYPDWQALDGQTFTVHSRGSTTEALARLVEQTEGIKFGEISYVPGSEVRATALLRGNVKAAVLDIPNKNFVMSEDPGRFHVLPTPKVDASDEMLFGNAEWLQQNEKSVQILLEELLTTWRSIAKDESFVTEERKRLGLLPNLPAELEKELLPYYKQVGQGGILTQDCGGRQAAEADFEFYKLAGVLKGDPASFKVEDYWDLDPMEKALKSVEKAGS
ncbi:MAG: ABC transporter substrate-binding protein [Streptomycetales bacterium]